MTTAEVAASALSDTDHRRQLRRAVVASAIGERSMAVTPWTPGHPLQKSAEGLRERVITHFELRDLYAKKPKLVGVSGCGKGAGVSTLASGLASSLSKMKGEVPSFCRVNP